MTSTRKFYRTVVEVEVLSEEPLPETMDLAAIHEAITDGAESGRVTWKLEEEVDAVTMARLLREQASDPEFFGIDDAGNDLA